MRRNTRWMRALVGVVLGLFSVAVASADTLNVLGGPGAFYGGWTANNNAAEFWDNGSQDAIAGQGNPGDNCNVGFWMTGVASSATCGSVAGASAISPTGTHDFLASLGSAGTNVAGFTLSPTP